MPFLAISTPSTPLCSAVFTKCPDPPGSLGGEPAPERDTCWAGAELPWQVPGELRGGGMAGHRVTGELQCHHMVKNHHVPLISFCLSGTCLGFQSCQWHPRPDPASQPPSPCSAPGQTLAEAFQGLGLAIWPYP